MVTIDVDWHEGHDGGISPATDVGLIGETLFIAPSFLRRISDRRRKRNAPNQPLGDFHLRRGDHFEATLDPRNAAPNQLSRAEAAQNGELERVRVWRTSNHAGLTFSPRGPLGPCPRSNVTA